MLTSDKAFLQGIVEADEIYVGGKPKKPNKREDDAGVQGKTEKTPVIGAVERDGNVVAKIVDSVTKYAVLELLLQRVDLKDTTLMTDENSVYHSMDWFVKHEVVKHSEMYVDGEVHTNTIEGFWSLLKWAWYGQHHHYKRSFMQLYVAEACYKYNNRKREKPFDHFVEGCFN